MFLSRPMNPYAQTFGTSIITAVERAIRLLEQETGSRAHGVTSLVGTIATLSLSFQATLLKDWTYSGLKPLHLDISVAFGYI